jgi:hypothetical protein
MIELMGVIKELGVVFFLIYLPFYLYHSFALFSIAHKTGTTPAWLAFIPIGDLYIVIRSAGFLTAWFVLWLILLPVMLIILIVGEGTVYEVEAAVLVLVILLFYIIFEFVVWIKIAKATKGSGFLGFIYVLLPVIAGLIIELMKHDAAIWIALGSLTIEMIILGVIAWGKATPIIVKGNREEVS